MVSAKRKSTGSCESVIGGRNSGVEERLFREKDLYDSKDELTHSQNEGGKKERDWGKRETFQRKTSMHEDLEQDGALL